MVIIITLNLKEQCSAEIKYCTYLHMKEKKKSKLCHLLLKRELVCLK